MSEYKGLEMQFCSDWSGWDTLDTFSLQFYDAVLLPHIAEVVGAEVAEVMTVCGETSTVTFWLGEDNEKVFKIEAKLVVDKA